MSDFDGFYREHLRLVYALALARGPGPGEAEDLTQETFLRAWRHHPQLRALAPEAQRAWLVRTLRNLATDRWRHRRLEESALREGADPPADAVVPSALALDVARALRALPEGDREIVILRYFQGMNSREIGEFLGLPKGTVRRRLSDCRRHLEPLLAEWGPAGEG